jgi:hypothetical protein
VSPRPFPYGPADRAPEARWPGGLLRTLGALEHELRQLPEWDVLAPGLASSLSRESDDLPPESD